MRSFLFCLSHNRMTGVATFVFTVAQHLKRLGHDVAITLRRKETAYPLLQKQLAAHKLLLTDDRRLGEFSHVVFSDLLSLRELGHLPAQRLFVAHGLGEPLLELKEEHDVQRVDHLFCVSRFMLQHYSRTLPALSKSFFPNVIDTTRFQYADTNKTLKTVLVNDRRTSDAYFDELLTISRRERILFMPVSQLNFGYSIWDMEKRLPRFDLVLAYGRSAYEAMSCARNVIVFGQNGGDGFITPADFGPMFERNCSGWGTQKLKRSAPEVWEQLAAELKRFHPEAGRANRRLAVEHLEVERHIETFLQHCS
jgi:hypothetical protein